LTLCGFKNDNDLKSLALFWLCCQTDSTVCFDKSTGCFCENLNRILVSGFNLFEMISTTFGFLFNCFDHVIEKGCLTLYNNN